MLKWFRRKLSGGSAGEDVDGDGGLAGQVQKIKSNTFETRGELNQAITDGIASEIMNVLNDPRFKDLSLGDQFELLDHVEAIYTYTANRTGLTLAPRLCSLFNEYLENTDVDLFRLIRTYNLLFYLYWSSTCTNEDARPFDREVVIPFSRHLIRHCEGESLKKRTKLSSDGTINVCYLSMFCYLGDGNALANIIYSCLEGHHAIASGKFNIHLYAWMYYDDEFIEKVESLGVKVTCFELHKDMNNLAKLRQAFFDDSIDVLITDTNGGVATYLFESRVAPIQVFYDLGMPFWSLKNMDSVISMRGNDADYHAGYDYHELPITHIDATIWTRPDQAVVDGERSKYPAASHVLGYYGRAAKVNESYLNIIREILRRHDDAIFILGCTGDASLISGFIAQNALEGRLILVNEFVDGHLYSEIFDIFMDTFPLVGGISCREAMAKEKPVVSMVSEEWNKLISVSRDPELVARDADAYTTIVDRLISDESYYREAGQRALQIVEQQSRAHELPEAIEEIVSSLVESRR